MSWAELETNQHAAKKRAQSGAEGKKNFELLSCQLPSFRDLTNENNSRLEKLQNNSVNVKNRTSLAVNIISWKPVNAGGETALEFRWRVTTAAELEDCGSPRAGCREYLE